MKCDETLAGARLKHHPAYTRLVTVRTANRSHVLPNNKFIQKYTWTENMSVSHHSFSNVDKPSSRIM